MFAVSFRSSVSKKGLTQMASRANQQLRDNIWDYRYKFSQGALPADDENVVSFARQPAKTPTALKLVQQAAELFEGIEKQARETEARAQSLCKSAAERLQLAEKQRDAAERARHDVVNEFNGKLEDVTQALDRAQQRVVAAEDHALAAEFRAQAAEAQLYKANQELAAIEDVVRKRLL
jgi:Fe2+ transport system protein B